jgi:hypothetical protein
MSRGASLGQRKQPILVDPTEIGNLLLEFAPAASVYLNNPTFQRGYLPWLGIAYLNAMLKNECDIPFSKEIALTNTNGANIVMLAQPCNARVGVFNNGPASIALLELPQGAPLAGPGAIVPLQDMSFGRVLASGSGIETHRLTGQIVGIVGQNLNANLTVTVFAAKTPVTVILTPPPGTIYIGSYGRLVPIPFGFKIQVSLDGLAWQDGPSFLASSSGSDTSTPAGLILVGLYARLIPLSTGFKIQVSTDGVNWSDSQTITVTGTGPDTSLPSGRLMIGTNGRIIPFGHGLKFQASADASTWFDADSYAAA